MNWGHFGNFAGKAPASQRQSPAPQCSPAPQRPTSPPQRSRLLSVLDADQRRSAGQKRRGARPRPVRDIFLFSFIFCNLSLSLSGLGRKRDGMLKEGLWRLERRFYSDWRPWMEDLGSFLSFISLFMCF